MALENFQTDISLDTLYKVKQSYKSATDQLGANLFIDSGSVDVYIYNGATEPTALANMVLNDKDTDISGIAKFDIVPSYIAIIQNIGTTTELVLSGIDVKEVGSIS